LIDVLFVFLSCARFIAFSKLSAVERLQLLAFIPFCFAWANRIVIGVKKPGDRTIEMNSDLFLLKINQ
tara:strand:- start:462 stop:665 length:204 start_codon:yes stop_codon:yes gene_type:complete